MSFYLDSSTQQKKVKHAEIYLGDLMWNLINK